MAASGLRAMKRVAKWSLVLVSGCLLAVLILGPWLALLLWTLFHNTKPPQIAEGIIPTSGRRDYAAIGAGLNSALQRTFPVGTSEAVLVSTLQRQGFKPLPPPPADCLPPGQRPPIGGAYMPCWDPANQLKYEWSDGPICGATMWVKWTSDGNGGITSVQGSYYGACL